MAFWTDNFEPKQNFKWIVEFNGDPNSTIYAVSVTKPNFQVQTRKFKNLNIEENYPINVTWTPIQITFVDTTDNKMLHIIQHAFNMHKLDFKEGKDSYRGYARAKINGVTTIHALDNNGNKVETWELIKAMPTKLEMTELNYRNDDLSTYKVTLEYEWATFNNENNTSNEQKNIDDKQKEKANANTQTTPETSSTSPPVPEPAGNAVPLISEKPMVTVTIPEATQRQINNIRGTNRNIEVPTDPLTGDPLL